MADQSGFHGANAFEMETVLDVPPRFHLRVPRSTANFDAGRPDEETWWADQLASHRARISEMEMVHDFPRRNNPQRVLGTTTNLDAGPPDEEAPREFPSSAVGLTYPRAEDIIRTWMRILGRDEEAPQEFLSSVVGRLDSLPVVSLDDLNPASQECFVCLEPFFGPHSNEADTPTLLRCGHIVGRACIQRWMLDGHDSCPFCRARISQPVALLRNTTALPETVHEAHG